MSSATVAFGEEIVHTCNNKCKSKDSTVVYVTVTSLDKTPKLSQLFSIRVTHFSRPTKFSKVQNQDVVSPKNLNCAAAKEYRMQLSLLADRTYVTVELMLRLSPVVRRRLSLTYCG